MDLLAAADLAGHPDVPSPLARLFSRTAPSCDAASRAAATDLADAVPLFASLQPLIERKRSVVVHLTGAGPGVGTTRVASALAGAAVRHRWCRTLRLDASGRPPDRHATELSLLAQHRAGVPLPDETAPAPAGRILPLASPADGIPRPGELAALYEALRPRFNLVLVDLEPVATAPDTAILAEAADLTLLVVRAEHSRRDAVGSARALLEAGGATAIALVLTGRRRLPAILDRLL